MAERAAPQPPSSSPSSSQKDPLKKIEPSRKRFQEHLHVPKLVLDGEGTIRHITSVARRMLEYGKEDHVPPSFFSHVHGRNIYQVMRDVADMVCYGKPRANWLLRLRTGRGRWQWFRASVTPEVSDGALSIHIVLTDL